MSQDDQTAGDEPEYGNFDLQTLLKHSNRIDQNVDEVNQAVARQSAMEEFGLVEPAHAKAPTKKQLGEIETLRARVAELETQLSNATEELHDRSLAITSFNTRVAELETENADLKSRLTPPPAPESDPAVPPVVPQAPTTPAAKPWEDGTQQS